MQIDLVQTENDLTLSRVIMKYAKYVLILNQELLNAQNKIKELEEQYESDKNK